MRDPSKDQTRMSSYPNLEYGNLYNAIAMLLDVASNIQYGLVAFGKAVLQCLGCILPFLDKDLIDNLPYLTASSISVLPPSLHQDIINSLCYYILPFTISKYQLFTFIDHKNKNFLLQPAKVLKTTNAKHVSLFQLLLCWSFNILLIQPTIVNY